MDPDRFKINQSRQTTQAGVPDPLSVLPSSPPHHYSQYTKPVKKSGKHYGWFGLGIILVALILAGAGYLAVHHSHPTKTAKKPVAVKHAQPKPTVASTPSIPSSSFTSPSFGNHVGNLSNLAAYSRSNRRLQPAKHTNSKNTVTY